MSAKCECVACEAGRLGMVSELDVLDRIAAAVAEEREACAVAVEDLDLPDRMWAIGAVAATIRGRGGK